MGPARIVGLVILGLALLGRRMLRGTPLPSVLIAVVGVKADGNLARTIDDRGGWESGWSTDYLPDDEDRSKRADLPKDDHRESREWLGMMEQVRALPEADRRAGGPCR